MLQFPSKKHPPGPHAIAREALQGALQDLGVDFICLAGFLKVSVRPELRRPSGACLISHQYCMGTEAPGTVFSM